MNNKQLMGVSNKSETAGRILKMVADRRRNTVFTAFSGLRADLKKRDGKPVDRKEFDETFTELESIGAGKLERSKRGIFLGFTWSIPLRQLGTLLKNKDEVGKPVAAPKQDVAEPHTAAQAGMRRKVTLVIIRRNQAPETIQTDEAHLKAISG